MARDIKEFEKNPMSYPPAKKWMEDVMSFIFTHSQENLQQIMPWGDNRNPSRGKKATVITDTSALFLSGVPPFWTDNVLSIEYNAPHAEDVEYGTDPKKVDVPVLVKWAQRKLRVRPRVAWGFARNISKKIAREGILPHPFLRPAISEGIIKFNINVRPPDF